MLLMLLAVSRSHLVRTACCLPPRPSMPPSHRPRTFQTPGAHDCRMAARPAAARRKPAGHSLGVSAVTGAVAHAAGCSDSLCLLLMAHRQKTAAHGQLLERNIGPSLRGPHASGRCLHAAQTLPNPPPGSYGAYGSKQYPSFNPADIALLDRGFALAVGHIRGGSELGAAWHAAGREENKARRDLRTALGPLPCPTQPRRATP